MHKVSAVILAGGLSTRMGREKATLPFHDGTLLKRVVETLFGLLDEVIVVANTPVHIEHTRAVPDLVKGKGPLGGIHSGLKAARNPAIFVAACDMPFLDRDLISYMIALSDGFQVVVPFLEGEYEPMHAYYSIECLAPVERALTNPKPRIIEFYPEVGVRRITRDEIAAFGSPERILFNANTPEDLERAYELERGRRDDPARGS